MGFWEQSRSRCCEISVVINDYFPLYNKLNDIDHMVVKIVKGSMLEKHTECCKLS